MLIAVVNWTAPGPTAQWRVMADGALLARSQSFDIAQTIATSRAMHIAQEGRANDITVTTFDSRDDYEQYMAE